MTVEATCEAFADDLPFLALGTLTGRERAIVLAHLEGCDRCSEELEQLSLAADSLLPLAPQMNPPAGFEVQVFERMGIEVPSRGRPKLSLRRRAVLGVAAGVIVLSGVFGVGVLVGRSPAPTQPQATPPVARLFESDLVSADHYRGELYLAQGRPGWLFMTVDGTGSTGYVTCEVVTDNGKAWKVGTFWLTGGSADWASALPVPADNVRSARLVASNGQVLASAAVHV